MFTSDIVNFVYKELNCYNQELQFWYQKYIFRYQKWTLLLVTITLLISIIDIFTSRNKNPIPEIKNEGDERRDLDVSDKCLMNANAALQSSRGWWNIASQHELWCTAHSLCPLCLGYLCWVIQTEWDSGWRHRRCSADGKSHSCEIMGGKAT